MEKKDYKSTLNMPQTDFSMKADLNIKEPQFLNFWLDNNIYQQALAKNKNNESFILHDGPPYANGSLHTGHALNKILKDIVIRYKTMCGFYSPYIPGWDTHGLPIENKILSEMKLSHTNISIIELRKKAAQYALEQIEIQKSQFQKLQLFTDFKKIYKTLDKSYEIEQLKLFYSLYQKGLIYKGLKPVYWSPTSQSALAEAEVEYQEHHSPSIFVKFKVIESDVLSPNDYLIIWTTTPWTLIANSGVAINKDFNYSLIKYNNENHLIATDLIDKLIKEWEWSDFEIIKNIKGKDLINTKYISPINNNISPVVFGHHVTLEAGTGLVHIAPLFGEDDFIIGKKNNLNMIMHINDDGTINDAIGQYKGIFYEDANKTIGQFLDENNLLVKLKFIKHSYPHDWRTKKPIIFRGTPQWFVSINKIKDNILDNLKNVKFYSTWGYNRLSNMIENRDDWTISRQRAWGVPIIIFYDENNEPILNDEIFNHLMNIFAKEGTNSWYEKSVDELLPAKYQNLNWKKEKDIMDVWFDSGSSFIAVDVENIKPPFDLYLEGSDQYRGWFNSSLINSVAYIGKAPYKAIVSHGFLIDEKGRKMSKSLGNGIDPMVIINKYGADILRLWVANSEYFNDISISENIIKQSAEMYRKIRNTIRFLLSNLSDYQYQKIDLDGVHLLINEKLNNLKIVIKENYDNYQFINVIKNINNFIIDLSSFYLSITKDTLYVEKKDNQQRRMIQFNFYNILEFLLISLAPILPTTCEEAYQFLLKDNKKVSIFLENFYSIENKKDNKLEDVWKEFFDLKNEIYKLIEEQIQNNLIKRSNEAKVFISTNSEFIKSLNLKELLMVGKVEFGNKTSVELFQNSIKCQRCWNHFEQNEMIDDICFRCSNVINN
ncbi:isoleucine--tRNA ligase [Metamycoplasma sualvi]|uniref:isoleucine--tRNA ligase n=1 Tax=Metamycoplasma sualvi TaxID=2125 RepID=UPI0038733724